MKKVFYSGRAWKVVLLLWGISTTSAVAKEYSQLPPSYPSSLEKEELTGEFRPENLSITKGSIMIQGVPLEYTATCGYMLLFGKAGKLQAKIFFVAYEKKQQGDRLTRPLTFAFNGGPGAASIWLHLGSLGPRRIPFPEDGRIMPKSPHLIDNEFTWLKFTDLVFIDPIGTGYSRAAAGVEAKPFYGVEGDVHSLGSFIRSYTSRFNRWLSPKFLAGESYGTTRAVGLAGYLQDRLAMNLRGLVLISTVLNFQAIIFERGNTLPYILSLPSYTATAWYHKKLAPDLQKDFHQTLAEAQRWTVAEYLPALAKGDDLPDPVRHAITKKLAYFTGLSPSYIEINNLQINSQQFIKELLRSERRLVGLMDSRVVGIDLHPADDSAGYDPSFFLTISPFVAVMNDYVRRELKYTNDLPYQYLSRTANETWNYKTGRMGYLDVAGTLQKTMTKNASLKVFVAGGYFDLTTPYYSNVYMINHLDLDPSLRKNIQLNLYDSGHQIYISQPMLQKLTGEVADFFKKAE